MTGLSDRLLSRLAVEDFLYAEAALLDRWALDEWFALFTDDCTYVVPSTDRRDGDPKTTLTLIDDDRLRLGWRVERLKSRHAHREYPYSQTRRQITNVRVLEVDDDDLHVEAGVIVYRFRYGHGDPFVGTYHHTLVRDGRFVHDPAPSHRARHGDAEPQRCPQHDLLMTTHSEDLLAACRILDGEGLTDAFGHASVRVDGGLLISPKLGPG